MFKAGDKVRVVGQDFIGYGSEGTVLESNDGMCLVRFGESAYWLTVKEIERIEDMDISERLSEVIKENQNLKQQLSEQNIKLNKIKADVRREQGVSDEEFEEAIKHFSIIDEDKRYEIWGLINYFDLFAQTSLSEFVSKYKEYKDKQNEIKVGDEIKDIDKKKVVVTCITSDESYFEGFIKNGGIISDTLDGYKKTGKHYDIESILNGLKEGD